MSYGDSSAVFEQRALHMGLEASVLKMFVDKDKGYRNMALFAFSCNYAPGAASDKPFVEMLQSTLGRDPNPSELSILRRSFNESFANVAADIESQVKQTDESVSRKLAPAERAERLKLQQAKLSGLSIKKAEPREPTRQIRKQKLALKQRARESQVQLLFKGSQRSCLSWGLWHRHPRVTGFALGTT